MRSKFAAFAVCLLGWTGLLAQEPSSRPRSIRLDDLFEIKSLGDPQFSPDGAWVAYTVGESSLKKDNSETSVWMVSTGDGAEIRMTRKGSSASQPRWSPQPRIRYQPGLEPRWEVPGSRDCHATRSDLVRGPQSRHFSPGRRNS